MAEVPRCTTLSKGVTDLARDAAYVAVGLGVLGYQRAQVRRVGMKDMVSKDFLVDLQGRRVRSEVTRGIAQLDDLLETATQIVETSFEPLEDQLPPAITHLTTRALQQSREVRNQIRQLVTSI
jgi:hypothetical protein